MLPTSTDLATRRRHTVTGRRSGLGRDVRRELRTLVRWPQVTLAVALAVLPSAVGLLFTIDAYALVDELDLSSLLTGSVIALSLPLLAAAVAALPMASELRHHFVASTRTRTPVRRYLLAKVAAAALVGFVVFAVAAAVPVLAAFGVVPHTGWVTFHPETTLLTAEQVLATRPERYTFTQVFAAGPATGPWLYALVYSGWVGLNGALYTVLPVLLLVVLRSPVLALSAPLLAYNLASFVVAVLGLEIFSPVSTVFPFNLTQQPLWTVLVPFAVLLAVTVALLVHVLRTAPHRDVLS